jgi:hypothetical protein
VSIGRKAVDEFTLPMVRGVIKEAGSMLEVEVRRYAPNEARGEARREQERRQEREAQQLQRYQEQMQQYVQAPHPEQQRQQQQGGPGGPGDFADAPPRHTAPGDGLRRFETGPASASARGGVGDLVELDAAPATHRGAHRGATPAPSATTDLLGLDLLSAPLGGSQPVAPAFGAGGGAPFGADAAGFGASLPFGAQASPTLIDGGAAAGVGASSFGSPFPSSEPFPSSDLFPSGAADPFGGAGTAPSPLSPMLDSSLFGSGTAAPSRAKGGGGGGGGTNTARAVSVVQLVLPHEMASLRRQSAVAALASRVAHELAAALLLPPAQAPPPSPPSPTPLHPSTPSPLRPSALP